MKKFNFIIFTLLILTITAIYPKIIKGKVISVSYNKYIKLNLNKNLVKEGDKGIVYFYITLSGSEKIKINVAKIIIIKALSNFSIAKITSLAPGQNKVSSGYIVEVKTNKNINEEKKVITINIKKDKIQKDKKIVWNFYRHDIEHTGRINKKINTSPKLVKKIKLEGAITTEAIFDNTGYIYICAGKNLYKISPLNYKIIFKFTTKDIINATPVIYKNNIYLVSDDNNLYALDLNGSLKWKFKTNSLIRTSPIIKNNTIIFGSWDRYIYALNLDGSLKWKFKTNGKINSSPAVLFDKYVIFGSDDHTLYCLSIENGEKIWKFSTGGKIISSPSINDEGDIFFGSLDNYIYALNYDGTLKWRYKTDSKIYSSPAISKNGYIIIGSNDKNLYTLDFEGNLLWKLKLKYWAANSVTINNQDIIIYAGYDKTIYLIKNANILWTYKLNKIFKTNPTIDKKGYIYIGNLNKYLYIFK